MKSLFIILKNAALYILGAIVLALLISTVQILENEELPKNVFNLIKWVWVVYVGIKAGLEL